MLIVDQHPHNKSIKVSVLGLPNVGKSTLINCLMGEELSSVTHKAQTTRHGFYCIFTVDHTEVILIDTPGIHKTNREFNKRLNQQAIDYSGQAEIHLILVDISKDILEQLNTMKRYFEDKLSDVWVVFTKADKIEGEIGELYLKQASELFDIKKHFIVSCQTNYNTMELTKAICQSAQSRRHTYTKGEMSNRNCRFFVTQYIQEQIFEKLDQEVPYEIAVAIEEYKEYEEDTYISANIFVNRPSQRAIVIGSGGNMIKEIGIGARKKITKLLGNKVHLKLHVKIVQGWLNNNKFLEELGLPRAKDSRRVWRDSYE